MLPPPGRTPGTARSGLELPHPPGCHRGEGEDGLIKSAIGIGYLLCDGLGDTIRVSLTEDSPHEIPVCRDLVGLVPELANQTVPVPPIDLSFDPFSYQRRPTPQVELGAGTACGAEQPIRVAVSGGGVSPPIDQTLAILGEEQVLRRLDRAIAWIQG